MTHRVVLITGANKGIGYAVAELLLQETRDVRVYLGSRSTERGEQAKERLISSLIEAVDDNDDNVSSRIEVVTMDTSSDESVRAAATQLAGVNLYAIVNNAGVGNGRFLEETLQVNYWGVKRVVEACLPLLNKPGGRIVNVASAAGPSFIAGEMGGAASRDACKDRLAYPWTIQGDIAQLDTIAKEYKADSQGKGDWECYGVSKALLSAYTYLLAKKYPTLVINSVTPGFIDTDLTAGMGATKKPADGAVPIVHLILDESIAALPQGRFYGSDCKRSPLHVYRSPGTPEYVGPDGP